MTMNWQGFSPTFILSLKIFIIPRVCSGNLSRILQPWEEKGEDPAQYMRLLAKKCPNNQIVIKRPPQIHTNVCIPFHNTKRTFVKLLSIDVGPRQASLHRHLFNPKERETERERSCPLNYLDLLLYLSAIHRLVVSGKSFIKSCFISAPYITHKHFIWFLVIFKFVWSPKDVSHHDFGINCDKIQSPHKSEQHSFPGQCLRNLFLSSSIFVFLSTTCRL